MLSVAQKILKLFFTACPGIILDTLVTTPLFMKF